MRFLSAVFVVFIFQLNTARAQPDTGDAWSLQRCVQYATEHNISIKQDSITAKLARYTLRQSQLSQLPTLSANGSLGRSYGRSINPTTNQFVDAGYNFLSATVNSSLLVFGWLQVRNTIARNQLDLEAALASLDQLRDNVSLNVANSYLVALLAQEQINISTNQVSLTEAQLSQTRSFADAGRLPELNVAQLESQLATDSANLINSIASYNSAILDLKTLLNLDFSVSLSVDVPDVEPGDQLAVAAMQPYEVYQQASKHFGSVKSSILRVSSAEKGMAAAKGALYPQLSIGYQAGTNWASNYQSVAYKPDGVQLSGVAFDSFTNRSYNVYQPAFVATGSPILFGTQLNNNIRQSIFGSINLPILNGWQSQYNLKQSKLNLERARLTEYNAELTLKQDVYKAHNNATNSIHKYQAAKRAGDAANHALDFAKKRYDLGLTSTVDLLVTQNSAYAAAANLVSAKYDLIFKLKVIDYYLGKELKL